ncbi:MAG: hypothetical protein K9N51_04740 [Candidatus Pacebacteria bacterium]|nr:hypothetical protein [Candidatus Paceibacterota bacterium]
MLRKRGAWMCVVGGATLVVVGLLTGQSAFYGGAALIDCILDAFGVFLLVFGSWQLVQIYH